jgi:hypothetical protein
MNTSRQPQMSLRERWTRYCMKMECKICGEPIFNHEEDARAAVDAVLEQTDYDEGDPIECLRDGLSWFEHQGKYCDYHTHVLGKDD